MCIRFESLNLIRYGDHDEYDCSMLIVQRLNNHWPLDFCNQITLNDNDVYREKTRRKCDFFSRVVMMNIFISLNFLGCGHLSATQISQI